MTAYEQWQALCARYDQADNAHREALGKVTAQMQPGASGNPSMDDVDAWEAAREKLEGIDKEMRDLINREFPGQ